MLTSILGGVTLWATVALTAGVAQAPNPPVTEVCPEATWAEGFLLWELILLAPEQYKTALVFDGPSNVRLGAGFESEVAFTLPTGSQVTIIGETWDAGCNQWMRVQVDTDLYWMHGHQLQNL
ncbi:MAG: SH3 domain-containing protein [Leptolyngbya sp.]|nr:SH3 domain-containing protein [Leptolyngbya sp.]